MEDDEGKRGRSDVSRREIDSHDRGITRNLAELQFPFSRCLRLVLATLSISLAACSAFDVSPQVDALNSTTHVTPLSLSLSLLCELSVAPVSRNNLQIRIYREAIMDRDIRSWNILGNYERSVMSKDRSSQQPPGNKRDETPP